MVTNKAKLTGGVHVRNKHTGTYGRVIDVRRRNDGGWSVRITCWGKPQWEGDVSTFDDYWDVLKPPAVGDTFTDKDGFTGVVTPPAGSYVVTLDVGSGDTFNFLTHQEFLQGWTKVKQPEVKPPRRLKTFDPLW